MTAKTLAGAGLATTLAAGLMFWCFHQFSQSPPYWRDNDSIHGLLEFALLSTAGAGVLLVLRALGWWTSGDPSEKLVPRMFPEMRLHPVVALQRHRRTQPISGLPNFGMAWGFFFLVVVFIFMVIKPPPSHGLAVNLAMQDVAIRARNSPKETIGIYIDEDGRFYVNRTHVPRGALRDALQMALRREVFGTVYLEADPGCQFDDAAYAMAVIQDLDARLIWITPRMREELNRAGNVVAENASSSIMPVK